MKRLISIVICLGVLSATVLAFTACKDENHLPPKNTELLSPKVLMLNIDGRLNNKMADYIKEADALIQSIKSLNLAELEARFTDSEQTSYDGKTYELVMQDYKYKLTDSDKTLQVFYNDSEMFFHQIKSDKVIIRYAHSDVKIEYIKSSDSVSLSSNEVSYNITVNNGYAIDCDYEIPEFKVVKETYDAKHDFVEIECQYYDLSINSDKYIGYAAEKNGLTVDAQGSLVDSDGVAYALNSFSDDGTLIYTTYEYVEGYYFVIMNENYRLSDGLQPIVR